MKIHNHNSDLFKLFVEDLKNVKKNSKFNRKFNNKLQYWSYRQVIDKLKSLSQEEGFYLELIDPAYTSQTCSNCGELDKSARNGEVYSCKICKCEMDTDINAAINIYNRGVYNPSTTENKINFL